MNIFPQVLLSAATSAVLYSCNQTISFSLYDSLGESLLYSVEVDCSTQVVYNFVVRFEYREEDAV
jgi:hypothetical protein